MSDVLDWTPVQHWNEVLDLTDCHGNVRIIIHIDVHVYCGHVHVHVVVGRKRDQICEIQLFECSILSISTCNFTTFNIIGNNGCITKCCSSLMVEL